jgi:glyceraldehyde 3-phosphate dehydrogenase
MKPLKIGLNGFGRIGRAVTRIAFERGIFDIVAVNSRKGTPDMHAYLLKYDSVYRRYGKTVEYNDDQILVDGKPIQNLNYSKPEEIPWDEYGVDVVIDATGAFTTKEKLEPHIKGTVKKVILTAPAKDNETTQVVLGVNDSEIDWENEKVLSNASCTTNCAAPMFKVLHDNFGVKSGFLTTIHAFTQSQTLHDNANKKPDRSRSAVLNSVPSTTGAAKAVGKVIPALNGILDGMAMRVPVPTGSFTDISAILEKEATVEEINGLFKSVSEHFMKGILAYETDVVMSSDFIGQPFSCTFDSNYTKVMPGNMVKVFGWYDNEWGYSNRVVDLVERVSNYV